MGIEKTRTTQVPLRKPSSVVSRVAVQLAEEFEASAIVKEKYLNNPLVVIRPEKRKKHRLAIVYDCIVSSQLFLLVGDHGDSNSMIDKAWHHLKQLGLDTGIIPEKIKEYINQFCTDGNKLDLMIKKRLDKPEVVTPNGETIPVDVIEEQD